MLYLNLPYFSGMFSSRILVIFIAGLMVFGKAIGQQGDFCDAISVIMRDAPNKFRNVRGKLQQANVNATFWDCSINVPGTLKSRFVASMGLFYEGAFMQSKNKDDVQSVYDTYKALLSSCLGAQDFKMTIQPNFFPGMEAYKKLVYMQEIKDDVQMDHPPAHTALEATYSKDLGTYTVVMYIFEH